MTGTTLEEFVEDAQRREWPPGLGAVLLDVAAGVRAIADVLARAPVLGAVGDAHGLNVQGERQKKMDVLANEILLNACVRGGHVAAIASEEMEAPYVLPGGAADGAFLLAMDPLDGSSNVDVDVTVGTIFSVLGRPEGSALGEGAFLQPGARQLAAGYALYGPCTMLVLAGGGGVSGFTLDAAAGEFLLTHPDLRIPEDGREYAINASNARHWEAPVRRYVDECVAGRSGPRAADFNMRWVGSTVADAHRVLLRGGIFIHPHDAKDPDRPGKLRLLYEAFPMALVLERAGGAATTGRGRLLDVVPRGLHERTPVILGSRREVERLVRHHVQHDLGLDRPYTSPLFNVRSVLREG